MKYGKKNVVALLTVVLLGCTQSAMAQSNRIEVHPTAWTQLELKGTDKDLASRIAAQITANPANADALVKALVAANPEHAEAIVSSAIVTLDAGSTSRIVAAAVAAAPSRAAAITSTAVKAAPSQAAAITSAAVAAAPSQAVTITVAALGSVQNKNQSPAIINSALRVAPRDGQTVADLQSLATRNWTPQNNTQQNFSQSQQKLNSPNQQNDNNSPPPVAPVENLRGGASPS
ncbi:MAG TPA: hypothetical protein VFF26_12580 [Gallionella sp.]|nr:hypothetical protein [Gallionella sp.]